MNKNPYKLTRTAKKWFFEDRRIDGDRTLYYFGDVSYPYPTVDDGWLKERILFVMEMWFDNETPDKVLKQREKGFVLSYVFREDFYEHKWQRWQTLRALNIKDVEAFRTLLHQ